ncbi:MAG: preprotein translocase subunit SecG [Candidatus Moranbacteria bacterium]|nr:preprotein translocase subunit SecG [Candidatus Moranbacteria bacterium]
MSQILTYTQIGLSILLMISILLQNRGSGLSAAFGGDFSGFHTKRGLEKFLFIASSLLGFLFIANAIAFMIFSN